MVLRLLAIWLIAFVVTICSLTPVEVVGSKFFVQGGDQFYIKGVNYLDSSNTNVLANSAQCAIDAVAIRTLGANTIRLPRYENFVFDAAADYDSCMQSFSDNRIYVLIPLIQTNTSADYDLDKYNTFTSIIDRFQRYENTLGFEVSAYDPPPSGQDQLFKSIFRDLRAYRDAQGYRSIPIGVIDPVEGTSTYRYSFANFTACASPDPDGSLNNQTTPEFHGIASYAWCGSSSFVQSGYDTLTSVYGALGVPIFFAETGCNAIEPREFTDQAALFGQQMVDIWSGALVYAWEITGNDGYQLVTYSDSATPATPTPNADYSALSSQWATLNPTGTTRPSTTTFPSCPTTNSDWTVAPSATLPTIAGLVIATASGGRTSSATGSSPSNGADSYTDGSSGNFPTGAAAGIGVGVGLLLIIAIAAFFLLRRRRRNKRNAISSKTTPNSEEKPELYAGPVDTAIAGRVKPRSELPNGDAMTRSPNPSELHGKPSATANAHELSGATEANAPWLHSNAGYMPPELNSSPIFEASPGTQQKTTGEGHSMSVGTSGGNNTVAKENVPHRADATSPAAGITSISASNEPEFDESELAEEADIAVQELGLISVRKRTLTASAAAAGIKPEDLPGRKGEEFVELVQREQRVRERLDEIEKQRQRLT